MHYFALIQRIAAQVPLEAATGRDSRRMDVLRTAVSKLINTYISGTLFAVFRNPTFLIQIKRDLNKEESWLLLLVVARNSEVPHPPIFVL
jgi:hypothetical protein